MKANELRLGNWIYFTEDNDVFVMEIGRTEVTCGYFKDSVGFSRPYDHKSILPIPITEEWLERFGLEKVDEDYEIAINDGVIMSVGNNFTNNSFHVQLGMGSDWTNFIFIEYVHELQNLYFALTGEELELI